LAVFLYRNGDDVHRGINGEYNQVDYDAHLSEFSISRNPDGSVTVSHPVIGTDTLFNIDGLWSHADQSWYSIEDAISLTPDAGGTSRPNGSITVTHPVWGVDTLTDIDGIWFQGEQAWYSTDDLVNSTPVEPIGPVTPVNTGTLIDGVITGSNDVNDTLIGDAGNNEFFAGRGVDVIQGGNGTDTLRVDGDIFEWTFSANADGSVTMTHPTWGENTLTGIEQILSQRSGQTFSIDDAIASTNGLPRFRLDNIRLNAKIPT